MSMSTICSREMKSVFRQRWYEEEERRYYTAKVGRDAWKLSPEFDTDIADLMQYNRELYDLRVPLGTIIRDPAGEENSHRNRLVKMG